MATFFVDENDLALGKALSARISDVRYPGHPELPDIPRGTHDDVWLPVVGMRGLVVITRDQRIRYRPLERAMWMEHAVRGFVLTGRKSQSTAASLEILLRHWRRIDATIARRPVGPWMYSVTSDRVAELTLGS